MTIKEAIEKRVKFVRKPYWNRLARLEMPVYLENGMHGPWTYLHDLGFSKGDPEMERTPIFLDHADDKLDDWLEADAPETKEADRE